MGICLNKLSRPFLTLQILKTAGSKRTRADRYETSSVLELERCVVVCSAAGCCALLF